MLANIIGGSKWKQGGLASVKKKKKAPTERTDTVVTTYSTNVLGWTFIDWHAVALQESTKVLEICTLVTLYCWGIMGGFQVPIKRPTYGGQLHDWEAAVQWIFHLVRSNFFYLSVLMVIAALNI